MSPSKRSCVALSLLMKTTCLICRLSTPAWFGMGLFRAEGCWGATKASIGPLALGELHLLYDPAAPPANDADAVVVPVGDVDEIAADDDRVRMAAAVRRDAVRRISHERTGLDDALQRGGGGHRD